MTAFSASVHFRRRLFSLIQRVGSLAHYKFTITLDLYTGSSVYLERELNLFLIFLFLFKENYLKKKLTCVNFAHMLFPTPNKFRKSP